jgi:uncharacterized protein (TIGR03437 family)
MMTVDILHTPVATVTATIGGMNATVAYAGSAPGQVTGILQVEAVVPQGAGSGAVPVTMKIGDGSSQTTATIFVQ